MAAPVLDLARAPAAEAGRAPEAARVWEAVSYAVLELDLSLVPSQSGNPRRVLDIGIPLTALGVEWLDPAAAGLIFLRIGGPSAAPIPLAVQGRAWRLRPAETGGLWLDNVGNLFAAGTMLALVCGFADSFEPVS